MIPPYLFYDNIWSTFFNFLGLFNYENGSATIESPSELKLSSPPSPSLHFYSPPPSLPNTIALSMLRTERMEEEKRAKSLFLLESTASPLWQSMHSAGQAFTYWLSYRYMWEFWEEPSKATGRNWYQHITGKKAEFWLYRGFNSAPWLSQV